MSNIPVILCSTNSTWSNRIKKELFSKKIKSEFAKGLNKAIDTQRPVICIIDIETLRNAEMISRVKENKNVIMLFLSAMNVQNSALEYPKYEVIPYDITKEIIQRIENAKNIVNEEPMPETISKDSAIQKMKEAGMLDISITNDAEDDDFVAPVKKRPEGISKIEAIYEEAEDEKENLDDKPEKVKNLRPDNTLSEKEYIESLNIESELQVPKILGKPVGIIGKYLAGKANRLLREYRISRIKEFEKSKPNVLKKIMEIEKEENSLREESIKKRDEIIKDMSEKNFDISIFKDIKPVEQETQRVKNVTKEERQEKMSTFLEKLSTKIDSPKENSNLISDIEQIPITSSPRMGPALKNPLNKKDKISPVNDGAEEFANMYKDIKKDASPKIIKEDENLQNKTSVDVNKKIEALEQAKKNEEKENERINRENQQMINDIKESAKKRNLLSDESLDMSNGLAKLFEENRKKISRDIARIEKENSKLPNLPKSKLTDRSPMSRFYMDEKAKFVRPEIKSEEKPVQVRASEQILDEIEEKKSSKKGFFGFKKK